MDSSYRFAVRCLALGVIIVALEGGLLSYLDKDTSFLAILAPAICTGLLGLLVPNRAK